MSLILICSHLFPDGFLLCPDHGLLAEQLQAGDPLHRQLEERGIRAPGLALLLPALALAPKQASLSLEQPRAAQGQIGRTHLEGSWQLDQEYGGESYRTLEQEQSLGSILALTGGSEESMRQSLREEFRDLDL